jgi:hypothetical protein
MALNYFYGTSCSTGQQRFFATEATIQNSAIYELLIGTTNIGCFSLTPFQPTPLAQVVTVFNGPWQSCVECQADLTPTPSITATNTPTPSITSSATATPTNTSTPTTTPTNTQTQTPSSTTTSTPTPSVTQTPTNTATVTNTPTNTATRTPTPTTTLTNTPTPSITASPTATGTPTPTPSETPFGVFDVNVQYEAEACVECPDTSPTVVPYPHPADWVPVGPDGGKQGTVIDLSAVQLGGMHGLNN